MLPARLFPRVSCSMEEGRDKRIRLSLGWVTLALWLGRWLMLAYLENPGRQGFGTKVDLLLGGSLMDSLCWAPLSFRHLTMFISMVLVTCSVLEYHWVWIQAVSTKVKESEVAQSCPTLCDPMDCSLSGSSVHGIFQARVLEWIAISFSRGPARLRNWTRVSRIAGRCFTMGAIREAFLLR